MNHQRLYTLLVFSGVLPFVACAVLPWLGVDELGPLGSVYRIVALYGLVIVSFLAGVHWGTYLYKSQTAPINLFVTSNVVAVAVWFVALLANIRLTLLALIVAFAYLLFVDLRLCRAGIIEEHYWRTRLRVTLIALVALAVTILAHIAR